MGYFPIGWQNTGYFPEFRSPFMPEWLICHKEIERKSLKIFRYWNKNEQNPNKISGRASEIWRKNIKSSLEDWGSVDALK